MCVTAVIIHHNSSAVKRSAFVRSHVTLIPLVYLTLSDESSGTRKVFSFLPETLIALRDSSVVIADELDAKLFGYILDLFTDPDINKDHAQLICTSCAIVWVCCPSITRLPLLCHFGIVFGAFLYRDNKVYDTACREYVSYSRNARYRRVRAL